MADRAQHKPYQPVVFSDGKQSNADPLKLARSVERLVVYIADGDGRTLRMAREWLHTAATCSLMTEYRGGALMSSKFRASKSTIVDLRVVVCTDVTATAPFWGDLFLICVQLPQLETLHVECLPMTVYEMTEPMRYSGALVGGMLFPVAIAAYPLEKVPSNAAAVPDKAYICGGNDAPEPPKAPETYKFQMRKPVYVTAKALQTVLEGTKQTVNDLQLEITPMRWDIKYAAPPANQAPQKTTKDVQKYTRLFGDTYVLIGSRALVSFYREGDDVTLPDYDTLSADLAGVTEKPLTCTVAGNAATTNMNVTIEGTASGEPHMVKVTAISHMVGFCKQQAEGLLKARATVKITGGDPIFGKSTHPQIWYLKFVEGTGVPADGFYYADVIGLWPPPPEAAAGAQPTAGQSKKPQEQRKRAADQPSGGQTRPTARTEQQGDANAWKALPQMDPKLIPDIPERPQWNAAAAPTEPDTQSVVKVLYDDQPPADADPAYPVFPKNTYPRLSITSTPACLAEAFVARFRAKPSATGDPATILRSRLRYIRPQPPASAE